MGVLMRLQTLSITLDKKLILKYDCVCNLKTADPFFSMLEKT